MRFGTLSGPACNNTSVQGQSNTGSNTAGQTAGGGTGKGSGGGVNSANQGISQSQSNLQYAHALLGLLVHLVTIQVFKANLTAEATLLVKQPVVEQAKAAAVASTLPTRVLANRKTVHNMHNVYLQVI